MHFTPQIGVSNYRSFTVLIFLKAIFKESYTTREGVWEWWGAINCGERTPFGSIPTLEYSTLWPAATEKVVEPTPAGAKSSDVEVATRWWLQLAGSERASWQFVATRIGRSPMPLLTSDT